MQGTKVVIGQIYAVRRNEKLCRFTVSSVTTVRKGKHPSDFDHTIKGYIVGDDGKSSEASYKPDDLLGEFSEYKELIEQKRREQAVRDAEQKANREAAIDVAVWLYQLAGLPVASDLGGRSDYRDPIRVSYGHTVEINMEGVKALLEKIKVPA